MEVHIFESTDIFFNLAMEQELFEGLPEGKTRLLLWKNRPAVVMGRFQNPWAECDLAAMKANGVALARRHSGGGTVYHDLGNMNISFMDWNTDYDKERNNQVLINALRSRGLEAFASGRSDLQIRSSDGPKKISGAAFKVKRERSFHHCTMLLSANLDLLDRFLIPRFDAEKLESKAIASVRSKVANIKLEEAEFIELVISAHEELRGRRATRRVWSEAEMKARLGEDNKSLRQLLSWKWIFGETPLMQARIEKDDWELSIGAKKGLILEAQVYHPQLHPSLLEAFGKGLEQGPLQSVSMRQRLEAIPGAEAYFPQLRSLFSLLEEYFPEWEV